MSLSYKKVDGGEYWIYKSRFKVWQTVLISFGPMLIGYLAFPLMLEIRLSLVLFGIIFAFIYGMSSVPMSLAQRRALKNGKQIVLEKRDGFIQIKIQK